MKFKMKKAHALTQATSEQRILVFCEIVNSDFFYLCPHWKLGKESYATGWTTLNMGTESCLHRLLWKRRTQETNQPNY